MGAMVLLCGCGSAKDSREEPKVEPAEPRALGTGSGSFVRRNIGGDTKLWEVQWGQASLEYEGEGSFGGTMSDVKGSIFENDTPASTFTAKHAAADKAESWLRLRGGVRMESTVDSAELRCTEVFWDAQANIVKAKGDVRLSSGDFTVGPFQELWTTPKLDYFSTPDLFEKGRPKAAPGSG